MDAQPTFRPSDNFWDGPPPFPSQQVGYKERTEEASHGIHTVGIDLGKTVLHLVGLNLRGEVTVRKKFTRKHRCISPRTYRSNRLAWKLAADRIF